eukprot:747448-Hanusia_phi.AAC.5
MTPARMSPPVGLLKGGCTPPARSDNPYVKWTPSLSFDDPPLPVKRHAGLTTPTTGLVSSCVLYPNRTLKGTPAFVEPSDPSYYRYYSTYVRQPIVIPPHPSVLPRSDCSPLYPGTTPTCTCPVVSRPSQGTGVSPGESTGTHHSSLPLPTQIIVFLVDPAVLPQAVLGPYLTQDPCTSSRTPCEDYPLISGLNYPLDSDFLNHYPCSCNESDPPVCTYPLG